MPVTAEVLVDGPVAGVAAASLSHLVYGTADALTLLDATEQPAPDPLTWAPGTLASATVVSEATITEGTVQNGLLVAYGDRLLHASGAVGESPASAFIDGPVLEVRSADGVTALRTAERVYVSRRGTLRVVDPGGVPLGIEVGYDGIVWVATAADVVGLEPVDLSVFHHLGDGATSVRRVRGDGAASPGVWAVGDHLHHFDGQDWRKHDAPAGALRLVGDGVPWLVGADDAWQLGTETLSHPADALGVDLTHADADAVGRLVVATDAGLQRLSVGRPVVVHGLGEGDTVRAPRSLIVIPTAKDRVERWSAAAGGVDLPRLETGAVLLDPTALDEGPASLEVTVTWDDGVTVTHQVGFTNSPLLAATWAEDVGPIHAAHCAQCHEGTTSTVLDGYDAWVERFDDIISAVGEQRMPLGADPLSAEQIATLEAWQASGFLEE